MGFDPASMMMAGSGVMSLAKGIFGASGAEQSANANAQNYQMQAQIALNNAAIARQNAEWETGMGEYKIGQTGLVNAAKTGGLVAQQARGGIDVNSGSNLAMREAVTRAGVQDSKVAESDMARRVYGYQVQATNFQNQAMMDQRGAGEARAAGRRSAVASLLEGAGGAATSFGKFFWPGGSSGDSAATADAGAASEGEYGDVVLA